MKYIYQTSSGAVYSSRLKAHRRICKIAGENENTFLPCKEYLEQNGDIWISYSNGQVIVKKLVL